MVLQIFVFKFINYFTYWIYHQQKKKRVDKQQIMKHFVLVLHLNCADFKTYWKVNTFGG